MPRLLADAQAACSGIEKEIKTARREFGLVQKVMKTLQGKVRKSVGPRREALRELAEGRTRALAAIETLGVVGRERHSKIGAVLELCAAESAAIRDQHGYATEREVLLSEGMSLQVAGWRVRRARQLARGFGRALNVRVGNLPISDRVRRFLELVRPIEAEEEWEEVHLHDGQGWEASRVVRAAQGRKVVLNRLI